MLPSPTGAAVRLIPPVVYFGPFALMWTLSWWRPWTIPGGGALTLLGLGFVLSGVDLTVWAIATLMRAHTTFIPWDLSLIHVSEPTRLGMISYAVFCLKKK